MHRPMLFVLTVFDLSIHFFCSQENFFHFLHFSVRFVLDMQHKQSRIILSEITLMINQLNIGDRMKYFEALYLPVFFLIIGLILCFACLIKPDFALMMLAVNFILAPSIAIGALIQDLKTQETN